MGKRKAITRIPENDSNDLLELLDLHIQGKFKKILPVIVPSHNPENKRLGVRNKIYWMCRGFDQNKSKILANSRLKGQYEYYRLFLRQSREDSIKNAIKATSEKGITKENLIKKYGEEEGEKRYQIYCHKQSIKNTFEYKQKKFGWTKDQFDEFNKSRSVTKENLIKKRGVVDGEKIWNEYCERQGYTNKKEYFIEKYGEEEGTQKYLFVNFLKSHSLESYIFRYGIEKGKEKYLKYLDDCKNKFYNTCSDASQTLFDKIFSNLNISENFECLYGSHGGEKKIFVEKISKFYIVDFFCITNKKVIEYYGDYWHANPLMYDDNTIISYPNNVKKTAKEVQERDNMRIKNLIETDLVDDILVIWESEFINDPDGVVQKACAFIKGIK